MESPDAVQSDLDHLVLTEFPYPIAVSYRRVLEAADWPTRVESAIRLFEYGIRAIMFGMINQYISRDKETVSDPALNKLLLSKLPKATLGDSKNMLFSALEAYGQKRDSFFMKELYDLYWDTSSTPHEARPGIQEPYDRLIQIRNEHVHRFKPANASEWESDGTEVMACLREILSQFSFLKNYDLIMILERQGDVHEYSYAIYTGEQISFPVEPLRSNTKLDPGHFYLAKNSTSLEDRELLPLHPLLIFWQDPERMNTVVAPASDAALYETWKKNTVTYIAAALQRALANPNPSILGEVTDLVFDVLENVKQLRRKVQRLDWPLLQEISREIAELRFAAVLSKYEETLYLQRSDVKRAFDAFLESGKVAFLLLGKSGVGKSNFLSSLMTEYQNHDRVCLLAYGGAKLDTGKALTEIIGNDFERYLYLVRDDKEVSIKDFLKEVATIPDIKDHRVVLLIDAINEHQNAHALLRQIDRLIDTIRVPWFKVVISSRPEAWRVMKRGIKLSEERFFRLQGQVELGVELQAFGVELKQFSPPELEQVYGKYRDYYKLQTSYEEIPRNLLELLNDPLTLKLISETYRGRVIPHYLRRSEILDKYLDQLILDERLYLEDRVFLEQELMPLMMVEYENFVTAEQVSATKTTSGKPLFELIHAMEKLSNKQQINHSYVNLVNAEILMMRGSPTDYTISFNYERFYDYFAGKHILKSPARNTNAVDMYKELTSKLLKKPFLWGALQNALRREIESRRGDQNDHLFSDLAFTKDQITIGLLVDVLAATAERNRETAGRPIPTTNSGAQRDAELNRAFVERVLDTIWAESKKRSVGSSPSGEDATAGEAVLNAKRLAIEVAALVGANFILEQALADKDTTIRDYATLRVYSYWEYDHAGGYQVVRTLSEQTVNKLGFPRIDMVEILAELTALIVARNLKVETTAVMPLLDIWRSVLNRLPLLRTGGGPFALAGRAIRGTLYQVANAIIKLILASNMAAEQVPEFLKMFPLSAGDKAEALELLNYLDPAFGSLEPIKEKLLVTRQRGVLFFMLAQPILTNHCLADMVGTLPIEEWLIDHSADSWGLGSAGGGFGISLLFMDPKEIQPGWLRIDEEHALNGTLKSLEERGFKAGTIAASIITHLTVEGRSGYRRSELVPKLADDLAERDLLRDPEIQKDLIMSLRMVALKGYPAFALGTLENMQDAKLIDEGNKEIFNALAGMLARIGTFFPNELADYLALDLLKPEFKVKVRSLAGTGAASEVLGLNAWELGIALGIVPVLRPIWTQFLREVLDSSNMGSAVKVAVERMLNLVQTQPTNTTPPAPASTG